jgi:hypothetical protein
MKQRAKIVFEKEETLILRKSSELIDSFCPMCGAVVIMATPEAVSLISQIGEREIFRKIDSGEVHFIEGPKVYVCLNSMELSEPGQFNDSKGGHYEINK